MLHQRDSTRCGLEGLSCLPSTFQHVSTSKGGFNESGPCVVHRKSFCAHCCFQCCTVSDPVFVTLRIHRTDLHSSFQFVKKTTTGEVVFIHASVVHGAEVLMVGADAWAQVVGDHARAEGRARKAWGRNAWRQRE